MARIGPIFYFVMASNPSLIQPFFLTVAWIGAFTAFLAATQALVGYELKKILAYSTVSQIGYMMMALGLAGLSVNFASGLSAGLFQLHEPRHLQGRPLPHGRASSSTPPGSKYINEMGGMKDKLRLTFAVFLIAAASLSGIPPLSGFWSKDAVLALAWNSGQTGLFVVGSSPRASRPSTRSACSGSSSSASGASTRGLGGGEAGDPMSRDLSAWVPYVDPGRGDGGDRAPRPLRPGGLARLGLATPTSNRSSPWVRSPASTGPTPSFDFLPRCITLVIVAVGVLAACPVLHRRVASPQRQVIGSSPGCWASTGSW